jgi:hypothetical protein
VEEVQSDWGQEGKREGFAGPTMNDPINKNFDKTQGLIREKINEAEEKISAANNELKKLGLLSNPSSTELSRFLSGSTERASEIDREIGRLKRISMEIRNNKDWMEVQNEIESLEKEKYKIRASILNFYGKMTDAEMEKDKLEDMLKTSEAERQRQLRDLAINAVPLAPYVQDTNSWVKLGLKVALKQAVDAGAKKLAWTTGEQQVQRYSLRNQVDTVSYSLSPDGKYDVTATKDGVTVSNPMKGVTIKEVERALGVDVARRIEAGEGEKSRSSYMQRDLTGEQLEVGGKGMLAFYGDSTNPGIVGNVAKALVKELTGVTPEIQQTQIDKTISSTVDLGDGWETGRSADSLSSQPSIEITPELVEAVKQGMPQFSKGSREEVTSFKPGDDMYVTRFARGNQDGNPIENPESSVFNKGFSFDGVDTLKTLQARVPSSLKNQDWKNLINRYWSTSGELEMRPDNNREIVPFNKLVDDKNIGVVVMDRGGKGAYKDVILVDITKTGVGSIVGYAGFATKNTDVTNKNRIDSIAAERGFGTNVLKLAASTVYPEPVAMDTYANSDKAEAMWGKALGVTPQKSTGNRERLAPNGKPSNLNEVQYKQVRTPEFKKWFGDWENDPANASKIVDENGEPKVMYHGTGVKFDAFNSQYGGSNTKAKNGTLGFFFTDDSKVANSFGENVLKVFLNLRNPLEVGYFFYDNYGNVDKTKTVDGYKSIKDAVVKKANKNNYDEIEPEDIDKWKDNVQNIGYDGVIMNTQVDSKNVVSTGKMAGFAKPHLMHIAFNPNQIKSATANEGTFSAEDNRIQKSEGSREQQPIKETFTKAYDLYNQIQQTEGAAKKRSLTEQRKALLDANPTAQYIDTNIKTILDQLEKNNIATRKGNCP